MKKNQYSLFIDLDGVLADFDGGVKAITGKNPSEMSPQEMWPQLARSSGFYNSLNWTLDGRILWDFVKPHSPVILTGLPLGKWAEPQKREWCRRMLGEEVPVITCMSKDKPKAAYEYMEKNELSGIPVLVDDRLRQQTPWLDAGGIFILHLNAEESVKELKELINHE